MAKNKFKAELGEAKTELRQMLEEKELLETRIAKQKRRIAALAELADDSDEGNAPGGLFSGLTDGVRTVLRSSNHPLYAVEIRDALLAMGLPDQKNLLASVYTVLRRLIASNNVAEVFPQEGSGPAAYRWKSLLNKIFDTPIIDLGDQPDDI